MRRIKLIFWVLGLLALLPIVSLVSAGGEIEKSTILDRVEVLHKAPENMQELSLEQLQSEKQARQRDLSVIKQASDEPKVAKQKLLKTILEHDDQRLEIANVIPVLIKEYEIEGDFKKALLGYSETFNVDMREARKDVHTIEDYKSYDFRFSAVYMSMMFKFNENESFHERLKVDMKNKESAIGVYLQELDASYAKVAHDKYLIQDIYSTNELEQAIDLIDAEIAKRKKAELSLN